MTDETDSKDQEVQEIARRIVWDMVDEEMKEEVLMQASIFVSVHRKMMFELQNLADGWFDQDAS